MMRKNGWLLWLTAYLLVVFLCSCGGPSSVGVQTDVCIGMTQEALITVNGDPDATMPEEEGTTILGYDALELYGLIFRVDYTFDRSGLVRAVYTADSVEMEQAKDVYQRAYTDVVKAFKGASGFIDDGTHGEFGSDERVYAHLRAKDYTVLMSYEYGAITFLVTANTPNAE